MKICVYLTIVFGYVEKKTETAKIFRADYLSAGSLFRDRYTRWPDDPLASYHLLV